jgi:hypothetical protein
VPAVRLDSHAAGDGALEDALACLLVTGALQQLGRADEISNRIVTVSPSTSYVECYV